jgi:hypothetical protein
LVNGTRPPLFALSIALMFGAVLVYIAALIKLDELTMPKRFWPADQRHAQDWTFVLCQCLPPRTLCKSKGEQR